MKAQLVFYVVLILFCSTLYQVEAEGNKDEDVLLQIRKEHIREYIRSNERVNLTFIFPDLQVDKDEGKRIMGIENRDERIKAANKAFEAKMPPKLIEYLKNMSSKDPKFTYTVTHFKRLNLFYFPSKLIGELLAVGDPRDLTAYADKHMYPKQEDNLLVELLHVEQDNKKKSR